MGLVFELNLGAPRNLAVSVDDLLEDVDEVAPVVTDRVSETGDVVAVAVAV
ncbi:hypothetical protein Hjap01_04130 [Haloarcula japonica]|uniref:Uncharacterized protein n=1 Tax=Haloarcula sebkhae TaxID=932660 RepID=A0A830ENC1_9EURY|nr:MULTISPECIES: hypothetical protein [Haloarcula]GGK79005.1 hypothetical protein GCM10009067_34110 [Haloarcula sebkhae]